MAGELLPDDRAMVLKELEQVFDARAAKILLKVLERVVLWARDEGITREDFRELKQSIAELAMAQSRTEESLKALAAAQARTDESVKALAEAQARTEQQLEALSATHARTEQQVDGLQSAMQRLAEAQARTEVTLQNLSRQVGGLSETVGGDIEDIAYIVLHDVLKREFGWEVGVLERSWQTWDEESEEVNVFGPATDPARPGQKIWIVGEAKHNLTMREAERFINQVERARQHLEGEVFAVCFCYRIRPEVKARVKEAGLRLVFSYGKLE